MVDRAAATKYESNEVAELTKDRLPTAHDAQVAPPDLREIDAERDVPERRARITWAHTIVMKRATWAWNDEDGNGRIPIGVLAIAAGREGTGKSSFGIWLAALITRGLLPGAWFGRPRRVLYVATEDSWAHTLAPRLAAAGANLAMVGRFDVVAIDEREVTMSLPVDNDLMEEAITEHDVAMVVLDPLMSLISARVDTHRTRDVRTVLDPLAGIADRTGAVLLAIAHFNKGSGSDPSSLITGSGAFKDVARAVFGFVRDDQSEDGGRVMSQPKNSLGLDGSSLPSLAYTIESTTVETPDGPTDVGRFVWRGHSERSAEEILRAASSGYQGDDERTERSEAADWLTAHLEDAGGSASRQAVLKAARPHGFSLATLKRAKDAAKVTHESSGFPRQTIWRLPGAVGSPPSPVGSVGSGDTGGEPTGPTGQEPQKQADEQGRSGLQSVQSAHPSEGEPTGEPTAPEPPPLFAATAPLFAATAPLYATDRRGTCVGCGGPVRLYGDGTTSHPECAA